MDFPYCKNHKLPHCNDFSESFPHSFQPFQHPKCVTHPRIPSFFQSQSKESSGQSVVDRLILKKHEIILLKTEFLGIFFPIKLMSLSQIHRKQMSFGQMETIIHNLHWYVLLDGNFPDPWFNHRVFTHVSRGAVWSLQFHQNLGTAIVQLDASNDDGSWTSAV